MIYTLVTLLLLEAYTWVMERIEAQALTTLEIVVMIKTWQRIK
jgi:hypothetical protein